MCAVRELTARRAALSPVDAIVMAKEHDVPAWLAPAYAELVRRPAPLRTGGKAQSNVLNLNVPLLTYVVYILS